MDPGPGDPKTCGPGGSGSGFGTLLKTVEIKVYFLFLLDDGRIRI
jgi:hypothetical protein